MKNNIHFAVTTAIALGALSIPAYLFAAEDTNSGIEKITITADFRPIELKETAGSVSVVNSELAELRGAQHIEEILQNIPNVTWTSSASRSRFIQMRGIGDLEQYAEPKYYPAVGMILDDIELGDAANAGMLFDTQQVEVLRGPQGVRFGASAYGGLLKIQSNPATSDFQGIVSGGLGNYGQQNVGLVLNGALAENLNGRIGFQNNKKDGFIKNDYLAKDDTSGTDETTARLKLNWQATESSSYDFNVLKFNSDSGMDAWSFDNPRATVSDEPGKDDQNTLAFSLKGSWQLSEQNQLSATISSTDSELDYAYDADWNNPEFCQLFVCTFGTDMASEQFLRDRQRTSLDVRLTNSTKQETDSGQYVIGVYGNQSDDELDYFYNSIWYGDYSSNSEYEADRFAIYAEYEYFASNKLSLAAGIRLETVKDDFIDSNGFSSSIDSDLVNLQLTGKYKVDDGTLLYGSLAQAEKPGGVNVAASAQYNFMSPEFQQFSNGKLTFEAETLSNLEVGVKSTLWNRLSLNAAIFYNQRENAQLENWMWDAAAGLWIGYLDSTSDANSYGVEIDSSYRLNNNIRLYASIGLLETEVDAIETFDLDQNVFVTKLDRAQAKSPSYQYSFGLDWLLQDAWLMNLSVQGQGDNYFGYYHDGELEGYSLVNLSAQWQSDNLTLTFWGRNLADQDYAVHGLYFAADPRDNYGAWANQTFIQLGEPRTYGVNASYSF